MKQLENALDAAVPFVRIVALIGAIVAAWLTASDVFPVLKQVWAPRGSAQNLAILAAALALVAKK